MVLAGPPTLMPYDLEAMGVKATTDVDEALRGADVVMGLRIQLSLIHICVDTAAHMRYIILINQMRLREDMRGARAEVYL